MATYLEPLEIEESYQLLSILLNLRSIDLLQYDDPLQKLNDIVIAASADRDRCIHLMNEKFDEVLKAYFTTILRDGYTSLLKA